MCGKVKIKLILSACGRDPHFAGDGDEAGGVVFTRLNIARQNLKPKLWAASAEAIAAASCWLVSASSFAAAAVLEQGMGARPCASKYSAH